MYERRLYVLTKRGEEGPFQVQELNNLVRSGRIGLDDQLRNGRGQTEGTVRDYLEHESDAVDAVDVADDTDSHREQLVDFADERPGMRHRGLLIAGAGVLVAVICLAYFMLRGSQDIAPQSAPIQRLPMVSIEAESASWMLGREGAVTVRIERPEPNPLTVPLQISGTAIPGVDFPPLPEQVVIPAGQISARVPVLAYPVSITRSPAVALTVTLGESDQWTAAQSVSATVQLANEQDQRSSEPKVTWLSSRKPIKVVSWTPFIGPPPSPAAPGEHVVARPRAPVGDISAANMVIQGVRYAHGIILHAGVPNIDPETFATYAILPNDQEFLCDIGISDDCNGGRGAIFQIWVDDKPELDSGVIGIDAPAKSVRIQVAGGHRLRLVAKSGGTSNSAARTVWGGARFVQKPSSSP